MEYPKVNLGLPLSDFVANVNFLNLFGGLMLCLLQLISS
jgi:hypothetical protein